jgi:L-aminopeptidase/D-esterase-like protein
VFLFPEGVAAAADVRGGSYATLYTDQLVHGDGWLHGICLAGGSIYGLEAATGVAAELLGQRDYSTHWDDIAHVAGAIIFDYGRRGNAIYPDKALGRAATLAARAGVFVQGPHGAGRSATVGKDMGFERVESAGQGGAIRQVGAVKVAVFTVVNAIGAIVDRDGRVVRGHLNRTTGQREHSIQALDALPLQAMETPSGNTTLTVVVTNVRLGSRVLRQLAKQVHASMARAIQPFNALSDGDVLYAVTTNAVADERLSETALGVLASETAWDAVLECFDE